MRSTIARVFVVLLLAVAVAGCASTPDARIEKSQELFDSYSAEVQAQIRSGVVATGFSEDMVRMALGDPDETTLEVSEAGQILMWGYTKSRPGISVGVGGGGYSHGSGGGGAGVRMGSGPRKDYTAIVEFESDVVSRVRYFTQ